MVVRVSLLEAYTGVVREIEVMKSEICDKCNGTGAKAGTKPETCSRCHGTGQIQQRQQSLFGNFVSITTCPDCHGTGKIIREKCEKCKGVGYVRKKHKLDVKIPAGVERNSRLRIPEAGEPGINGGSAGDLYLIIDVELNSDFERDRADLHTSLLLTYPQAVLGTETEIKTLDGSVEKISVPILFIHGDADGLVPYEMMNRLFDATNSPVKEKFTVEGAGHADAKSTNPTEYFNHVFKFLTTST